MPRGKRKQAQIDKGKNSPTKKSKVNTPSLNKWEFEQQPEQWVGIVNTAVLQIEKASQDSVKKVNNISLKKDVEALVNIETMKYTKKGTKEEKNIRCSFSHQKAWIVWSWEDLDSNSLNYFPLHISNQLEKVYSENSDQDVSFKLGQRKYEVDLSIMKMINSKKKEVAVIKRLNIAEKNADGKVLATSNGKAEDGNNEPCPETGDAVVDPACKTKVHTAHVFKEDNIVWDAMLNQTNIQFNNNKFFKLQILEDNTCNVYSVWFHWGRVGKAGQNNLTWCGNNIEKAKQMFEKKFFDKTKNSWSERENFQKVDGKYDLVIIDYSLEKKYQIKEPPSALESKLPLQLQKLMELIFNVEGMENAVKELNYDVNKAPLGNLTNKQIAAGYEALTEISKLIKSGKTNGQALLNECNKFFTRIPHYFGMKRPPLINTLSELKKKIELMDMLGDIKDAMLIIDEEVMENLCPVDSHYKSLHCKLELLDPKNSDFKLIKDFLMTSHASMHLRYSMELLEIFICERENDAERFNDVGNKMLLWHGSRISNYGGILSQGLRIAPPEAPVTGYMFGKGIYFADMSSKSANYCCTSQLNDIGLLLLSEVALGNQKELVDATYSDYKLPSKNHSVKGLGQWAPDSSSFTKLLDGTVVPYGKESLTNVTNPNGYTLLYNEYIVYNPNQVKMRYLLKVRFIYD